MASWTQKKQLIAIGTGASLVCILAVVGVFYVDGQIGEIEATITQKQEAITAAQQKIGKIGGLEKDVIILRENLDEYVKILPDSKELTVFMRILNQFERQSGLVGRDLLKKPGRAAKGSERFELIEYSYELKGTLWEFLKFVNLAENYERFINIADFSIKAGSNGKEDEMRDGEVVHEVKLTLQTYSYNGKAAGKEAEIPDYASRREELQTEIFKRMQAIRIEKYDHKGRQGRRDVLVDPRMRGDVMADGLSQSEQRAILDRYVAEAKGLDEMLRRTRRQDTTLFDQYALEKALRDGLAKITADMEVDEKRLTYPPYRVRWAKEVVGTVDELRGKVAKNQEDQRKADPFLPQKELEMLVTQLAADCKAGQLEEAKSRYELVATRLAVPPEDARHELAVAAKTWHTKAVTALDFSGMDLKIQGVVVDRSGRSGLLLNGEVYEEGEYVSDELLVKMVEEEQVWFVFRGLTLVRTR